MPKAFAAVSRVRFSYILHASILYSWISIDNFENASLPTTSPEERRRLLSFVVCGGGPTGVETAAEIYDLCQEDIMNYVSDLRGAEPANTHLSLSSTQSCAARKCRLQSYNLENTS